MTSSIQKLIDDQAPESLHVEYKRSILIIDKKRDEICKAVSAMANSDGGQIFFGIAENKQSNSFELDGGIPEAPRNAEWLDSILADNISPRILDVHIEPESVNGVSYLRIDVPKSDGAPHQAPDKRFYKRSNNRSFPMEAYEIDDVRHRRLSGPSPITVNFEIGPSILAHLVVSNRSQLVCRNLRLTVASNFPMNAFDGQTKHEIALSRVGIGQRIEYMLGTTVEILGANKDAALEIEGFFYSESSNNPMQIVDRISIGELMGSAIPQNETSDQLKKIADELRSVRGEIRKSADTVQAIVETLSGSGIRISPYSVFQLSQSPVENAFQDFKYDAYGLSLQGMAEVLETTTDTISSLHHALQIIGGGNMVGDRLKELPPDVAERARNRLNFKRF